MDFEMYAPPPPPPAVIARQMHHHQLHIDSHQQRKPVPRYRQPPPPGATAVAGGARLPQPAARCHALSAIFQSADWQSATSDVTSTVTSPSEAGWPTDEDVEVSVAMRDTTANNHSQTTCPQSPSMSSVARREVAASRDAVDVASVAVGGVGVDERDCCFHPCQDFMWSQLQEIADGVSCGTTNSTSTSVKSLASSSTIGEVDVHGGRKANNVSGNNAVVTTTNNSATMCKSSSGSSSGSSSSNSSQSDADSVNCGRTGGSQHAQQQTGGVTSLKPPANLPRRPVICHTLATPPSPVKRVGCNSGVDGSGGGIVRPTPRRRAGTADHLHHDHQHQQQQQQQQLLPQQSAALGGQDRAPDAEFHRLHSLTDVRATTTPVAQLHILSRESRRALGWRPARSTRDLYEVSTSSLADDNDTPSASPLDALSDAMLVEVLSNLTSNELARVASVSRRFYAAAWHPTLWREIHITGDETDVDGALKSILRVLTRQLQQAAAAAAHPTAEPTTCGHHVRQTSAPVLPAAATPADHPMAVASSSRAPWTPDRLSYDEARFSPAVVPVSGAAFALSSSSSSRPPSTVSSIVSASSGTYAAGATAAARTTNGLSHINMHSHTHHHSHHPRLDVRQVNKPDVQSVQLAGCRRLTDRGLALIARRCNVKSLRALDISQCVDVTNGGLMDLLSRCTAIEEINVAGCRMLSTVTVHQPPASATPAVVATTSVERVMCETRHILPRLTWLDVSDCPAVDDYGVRVIASTAPHLQQLHMRRCVGITDDAIRSVVANCLQLSDLSVSDCERLTDASMEELARLGPNLRYLSVAKCHRITEAGVRQVARFCYKLRYLNIRGCETVGDDAIVALGRSCNRLRSLDLGKCDVSDVGLDAVATGCPNLRRLSLKSCELLSDRGVARIAYCCRGLQQLNVQDCPITVDAYRAVKQWCRRAIIEHSNPSFY